MEKMDSNERGMNPVAMIIINPWKEYWPSWEPNQRPVLNGLYQTIQTLKKEPFENIVGKGENAGTQHFLLFPQYFLPNPKQNFFQSHIKCLLKCFHFGLV